MAALPGWAGLDWARLGWAGLPVVVPPRRGWDQDWDRDQDRDWGWGVSGQWRGGGQGATPLVLCSAWLPASVSQQGRVANSIPYIPYRL